MNDTERVRRAVRLGGRMLGPVERQRCDVHRRRWVCYRWTWPASGDIESSGEVTISRACEECADAE